MAHIPANERSEQLLDAAIQVIATEGMRAATTRRIAEVAGAPLTMVHYCFGSKEGLYLSVFERVSHGFKDYVMAAAVEGDLPETAAQVLEKCIEWSLANPSLARANLDLTLWASRHEDAGGSITAQMYRIYSTDIYDLLAGASTRPNNQDELATLSRQIVALSDGLTLQWVAHGDDELFRADGRDASGLILDHARRLERAGSA